MKEKIMKVNLRLSFPYDRITGSKRMNLQYPQKDAMTLHDFFIALSDKYEEFKKIIRLDDDITGYVPIVVVSNTIARNETEARKRILLKDGDEVFLLYPLTGG